MDKGFGEMGRIVLPLKGGKQLVVIDAAQLTESERVSLDKFAPDWNEFARLRQIPGRFAHAMDDSHFGDIEAIFLSKWYADQSITPWRTIAKPHPLRDRFINKAFVFLLPDVYHSSTDAVIDKKTTRAVVKARTTDAVVDNKKTRKP